MASYSFTIPALPPSANALFRGKRSARVKLARTWALVVAHAFRLSGIPEASGRRRVTLAVTYGPGRRPFDCDAFLKSGLDALVACKAIRDDSPRWCQLGPSVDPARGPSDSVTFTLEDVAPMLRPRGGGTPPRARSCP